ncbi:MFS transporter [Nocardioides acrostichi]|uniref:MFS transporter n=1 Tax=Nocardioides acrostichi TaxID=2784339 RepID=A0A930Y7B3_9ACTN|nr:MFS transporter [Nocardioides acrostichi]MBF4163235.1 MFS transporter [Nocardioides acrostichi]
MTTLQNPQTGAAAGAASAGSPDRRTGRWIDDWHPEDPTFWENGGASIARRNLAWSIFAEHLGFSVWLIWSVSAAMLGAAFGYSPQQLFFLVAAPNLVGSLVRVPYTFAVPRFGGRNWTVASAAFLLVPTLLYVVAVQHTGTPYWAMVLIAATAGLGGGNFASSMANINAFYPADKKGAALGLNAAGGNVGVSVIQFALPVIVGGAGVFGLVKASTGGIHLERAGWVYVALALIATAGAYFFMNNLGTATGSSKETASVLKRRQTYVMSFLYIGTFGSFIGYSAAMPLLIKVNFSLIDPETLKVVGGINFAYYAFLGALVGSFTRPFGGWLADRLGGAKVTLSAFVAMIGFTAVVLWTLTELTPIATATDKAAAADANAQWFPLFLGFFLLVFAATGVGNGSAYRMIPTIWRHEHTQGTAEGSQERKSAILKATKEASAAVGIIGAAGAIGGFFIPMMFGAPWIDNPLAAVKNAFGLFIAYYAVCAVVTWAFYLRRGSKLAAARA